MVRFMYQRSTFVAYVRYSPLLLPFFSLRRFFITSQNLNAVPSLDLISYLDIAPLLPLTFYILKDDDVSFLRKFIPISR